jgi:hypothetical protein
VQVLKKIRSSASGCDDWGLVFARPANIIEHGRVVSRQLLLIQGGDEIDVTPANAADYLRSIERMYLGDGVLLQIRALQSGFYSVIPQEKIAILGPSGLLHHLGALKCPEFDPEDLRIGFEPKHGYTTESPQVKWLIETLLTFDEPQRRATVRFLTGSPSLPSGFQGLPRRLTVQLLTTATGHPAGDTYLPVIQACAGLFKLPRLGFAHLCHSFLLITFTHLLSTPQFFPWFSDTHLPIDSEKSFCLQYMPSKHSHHFYSFSFRFALMFLHQKRFSQRMNAVLVSLKIRINIFDKSIDPGLRIHLGKFNKNPC